MIVPYFKPKPDYQVLGKYLGSQHLALMSTQYPDGYPITSDRFYNQKMVSDFKRQFKNLSKKYKLLQHYDNILMIVLLRLIEHDELFDAYYDQIYLQNRLKEFLDMTVFLNGINDYPVSLLLSSKGKKSVKVKDQVILKWLASLISKQLEDGAIPYNVLGFVTSYITTQAVAQLKIKPIGSSLNLYSNKLKAEFCFYILKYLKEETHFKSSTDTRFTNEQLLFLYELLLITGLDKEKVFKSNLSIKDDDYEADTYVRSILENYIKKYVRKKK